MFKLTTEKKLPLQAYTVMCMYAQTIEFENQLLQDWLREALQSLIPKLSKATARISERATLQLNKSEALALYYACGMYLQKNGAATSDEMLTAKNFITEVGNMYSGTAPASASNPA